MKKRMSGKVLAYTMKDMFERRIIKPYLLALI